MYIKKKKVPELIYLKHEQVTSQLSFLCKKYIHLYIIQEAT